jgi:ABC-type dipeptide/oligopeptide/nickel transport system permease subunit
MSVPGGVSVDPPVTTLTGDDAPDLESAAAGASAAAFGAVSAVGQWRDIRRRFLRNPLALIGLVLVIALVLIAILAPWISPFTPKHQDLVNSLQGPSWKHPFGTDVVGRDQLTRVFYGTRIALEVGLSTLALSTLIGVVLGAVAGYFGKFWDALIMRICDIFFAFPFLVGAVLVITVAGQGVPSVILAIVIFTWSTVARLLRGSILSVREAEYVEAARSLGGSSWRIVTRHILPNTFAPVLVYSAFSVGAAVVSEAALSYLGVGVKPDVAEWGNMISAGQSSFSQQPWLTLIPAGAVVLTTLAFVFIGDGLRDALDPKLR